MKKTGGKLLEYLKRHLAGIGIASVTVGMAVTVVKGAAGQEPGFDPEGIRTSFSSEFSVLPDRTGYDLSGQGEDGEEVDHDAGGEQEDKQEEEKEEQEEEREETEEAREGEPLSLDKDELFPEEKNEQIILPDDMLDVPKIQDLLSEIVQKEDGELPGSDAGSLPGGLGEAGLLGNSSSSMGSSHESSQEGGKRGPSNTGGSHPSGGNETPGTETDRPSAGDKNPSGSENQDPSGGEQKPSGGGGESSGGEQKPGEPEGNNPPGGNEGEGGETPGKNQISIIIGGKEEKFENEDDALAWIADRYGEDENGKLFEGLIKDEHGNYTPSYADKDKFNGTGDVAYDYVGDSGVFVVPSSATSLDGAFASSLAKNKTKTIVIPKGVVWIDSSDFYFPVLEKFIVSADNPRYASVDGALYLKKEDGSLELVIMPSAKKEVQQWPDRLTVIGDNAFAYSQLVKAEMPGSVEVIGDSAFMESTVETIVLPEGVKAVGDFAFMYAESQGGEALLRHQVVVKALKPPEVTNLTFKWMDTALSQGESEPVTEIVVPDSAEDKVYEAYLKTWGGALAKTYGGEMALKILKTEAGAEKNYECLEINGSYYFRRKDAGHLETYEDDLGVYRVNEEGGIVLVSCRSKAEVVDFSKAGITEIEDGAFADCSSMAAVKLPESLSVLPENTFSGNEALKVIISYALTPPAEETGAPDSCAVFVRPGALEAYQKAWGGQVRRILGTDESYTLLASGIVFDQGSKRLIDIPSDLSTLNLPSYITSIAEEAARDNTALTSIVIPAASQLNSIGANAFSGCINLTAFDAPARIREVGEGAFAGCTGLETVRWMTAAPVSDSCFAGCSNLKSFSAAGSGHNLTAIGRRAFYECSSLGNVLYYSYSSNGSNYYYYYYLKEIGEEAFYGCTSMTYAYLHDSVNCVGDGAFEGSGLTQAYWYTAADVPEACFADCADLGTFGWGNGQTEVIRDRAFYGCRSLKELYLPQKLNLIGSQVFDGREESAVVLRFTGKVPPQWDGPDAVEEFTLYVPDSKEEDDVVYQAYWEMWEDWLGEEPEKVLKTVDGAQERVPGAGEGEEEKPEPEPEPEPGAESEAEPDSEPGTEPETDSETDVNLKPDEESKPEMGDKTESELKPEQTQKPGTELEAEENPEDSAPEEDKDSAENDKTEDKDSAEEDKAEDEDSVEEDKAEDEGSVKGDKTEDGDSVKGDKTEDGDSVKDDKTEDGDSVKDDKTEDEGSVDEGKIDDEDSADDEKMKDKDFTETEETKSGSIPEDGDRKEGIDKNDYQAVGAGDEGSRQGADWEGGSD